MLNQPSSRNVSRKERKIESPITLPFKKKEISYKILFIPLQWNTKKRYLCRLKASSSTDIEKSMSCLLIHIGGFILRIWKKKRFFFKPFWIRIRRAYLHRFMNVWNQFVVSEYNGMKVKYLVNNFKNFIKNTGFRKPPDTSLTAAANFIQDNFFINKLTLFHLPPRPINTPRSFIVSKMFLNWSTGIGSLVPGLTRSNPSMRPLPLTSPITGWTCCSSISCSMKYLPTTLLFSWSFSSSITYNFNVKLCLFLCYFFIA